MWLLWLVAGIIFTISEIVYSGFFLIWFAVGSFITMFLSFFIQNTAVESVIFLVISITLLLTLTKKFTQKISSKNSFVSNVDNLIEKKGVVTETIGKDHLDTGLVKLEGEIWTAVSENGKTIEKGTLVEVRAIKGVRLIVVPVQN